MSENNFNFDGLVKQRVHVPQEENHKKDMTTIIPNVKKSNDFLSDIINEAAQISKMHKNKDIAEGKVLHEDISLSVHQDRPALKCSENLSSVARKQLMDKIICIEKELSDLKAILQIL